jgi:hypothetical protein
MVGVFLIGGAILRGHLLAVGIARVGLQAPDIQPAQIAEQVLQGFERDLKFVRDFRLGGIAAEAGFAVENGLLEAPGLAAEGAGAPIDLAEAV